MLDRLTIDDFAPALGQPFVIDGGRLGPIELKLAKASTHDPQAPPVDDAGTRSPFTLLFRGPPDPVLAQQICRLENATVGQLEIFIVPVGRDADGTDYEAVFA